MEEISGITTSSKGGWQAWAPQRATIVRKDLTWEARGITICKCEAIAINRPSKKKKIIRRRTRQRRVILEELRKVTSHPTAEELHQMVRTRLPGISIATVYRNLEVLVQEGHVLQLDISKNRRRFDGIPHPHYHIRCIQCGRVDDVPIPTCSSVAEQVEKVSGYREVSHVLEFTGLCPECTVKR